MTDTGELYHFSFSLRQWRGPWRLGAKQGIQGIQGVSWQGACSSSSGDWILVGITEANAQVWQLSRKALQVAATHVQIEDVRFASARYISDQCCKKQHCELPLHCKKTFGQFHAFLILFPDHTIMFSAYCVPTSLTHCARNIFGLVTSGNILKIQSACELQELKRFSPSARIAHVACFGAARGMMPLSPWTMQMQGQRFQSLLVTWIERYPDSPPCSNQ